MHLGAGRVVFLDLAAHVVGGVDAFSQLVVDGVQAFAQLRFLQRAAPVADDAGSLALQPASVEAAGDQVGAAAERGVFRVRVLTRLGRKRRLAPGRLAHGVAHAGIGHYSMANRSRTEVMLALDGGRPSRPRDEDGRVCPASPAVA